jgi:hypothetical protein
MVLLVISVLGSWSGSELGRLAQEIHSVVRTHSLALVDTLAEDGGRNPQTP